MAKTASPEHAPQAFIHLLNLSAFRKVPVMLQTETSECGLICIAMIAAFYGHNVDLRSLRIRSLSPRGTTLINLIQLASEIGLTSRAVRVDLKDLNKLKLPCVLHWNLNHFVVLTKVGRKRITIVDPALGNRRLSIEQVNRSFTGVALELSPGPDFTQQEALPSVSLRRLTGSISGLGKGFSQVICLAFLLELLGLIAPQFMQLVIDQVITNRDHDLLTLLGVSFLLLVLVRVVVEAMRTWTVMWIGAQVGLGWLGNVYLHLLRLPIDYFTKRNLGDVMSRFGAISVIQQTLTTQFVVVILDSIMAIVTGAMLFYYSTALAIITVFCALLYAGMRVGYFRVFREAHLQQIDASAAQQGALIESIRGVQTIRTNGTIAQRGMHFINLSANAINASIVTQKLALAFASVNSYLAGSQRVVVLWIGAGLALKGSMSGGMLMACLAYADQFTARILGLADYAAQFRLLKLQTHRLAEIVLTETESHFEGTYLGSIGEYSLSLERIAYRYSENTQRVLVDCSLDVAPGEVVAVTGKSGGGKSTIAKLIMGIYDYECGSIRIGGLDLRHIGKKRLRSFTACVLQEDRLFSGSIMDNIAFGDPHASLERVQGVAEATNLLNEIEAMPMGFHTMVGDMGGTLSSGQQQRILLARALYREPKLLILDEATSHLDLENELKICMTLRQARITTLMIAHRPQTLDAADRVLTLKEGRLF